MKKRKHYFQAQRYVVVSVTGSGKIMFQANCSSYGTHFYLLFLYQTADLNTRKTNHCWRNCPLVIHHVNAFDDIFISLIPRHFTQKIRPVSEEIFQCEIKTVAFFLKQQMLSVNWKKRRTKIKLHFLNINAFRESI